MAQPQRRAGGERVTLSEISGVIEGWLMDKPRDHGMNIPLDPADLEELLDMIRELAEVEP